MELNPPGQYADDRNLRARQRLWRCQVPFFDVAAWVLDLAGLVPGMRVLDAGCGNGSYLRALRARRVSAVGCDLSLGAAVREQCRVLAPGGACVAVTTGAEHLRSLRGLIERAARVSTPGCRMRAPTGSAGSA